MRVFLGVSGKPLDVTGVVVHSCTGVGFTGMTGSGSGSGSFSGGEKLQLGITITQREATYYVHSYIYSLHFYEYSGVVMILLVEEKSINISRLYQYVQTFNIFSINFSCLLVIALLKRYHDKQHFDISDIAVTRTLYGKMP